jgi:transposase
MSPATLLRRVPAPPMPSTPAPQAVGVDEWAWRRGHCCGTVVGNRAARRVVGLLPARSAATAAGRLAAPPTLKVGCRERSDLYAEGMRRGAPDAAQVIDRFPLVHHLCQARKAFPLHHLPALQAAAVAAGWSAPARPEACVARHAASRNYDRCGTVPTVGAIPPHAYTAC